MEDEHLPDITPEANHVFETNADQSPAMQLHPPVSINASAIPTTDIPNMEVHHHPEVEKKGPKEYFLEFLMIFLAVTMGFIAENIREHISDREKEEAFMKSLVLDVRDDFTLIHEQQNNFESKVVLLDSLITQLNGVSMPTNTNDLYYYARLATKNDVFPSNTRTFEQMKNSGAFRLIKKTAVANAILSYYSFLPQIKTLEEIELGEGNEYRKIAVQVFSAVVFNQINSTTAVTRPGNNPPLRTTDKKLLGDLSGWVHYIKNTRVGLYQYKKVLFENGDALIKLIEKEYHIENE
jgi:hypothetical protein